MSTEVTLHLPDEVYHQAKHLAGLIGSEVPAVFADTITMSLALLGADPLPTSQVSEETDERVMALADAQMLPAQDQRLSELLYRQQAGELGLSERQELLALMQLYQTGLLRKAQALREAVRRGFLLKD